MASQWPQPSSKGFYQGRIRERARPEDRTVGWGAANSGLSAREGLIFGSHEWYYKQLSAVSPEIDCRSRSYIPGAVFEEKSNEATPQTDESCVARQRIAGFHPDPRGAPRPSTRAFPYTAKLCINGHEYVKRQLEKEGVRYQALDNGILSCDDPLRLQQLCDELSGEKIDTLFRKWLMKLPHPFQEAHRNAGGHYELSIWQAEFSLTQVLEKPVHGRIFFEEMIRENLDIGRPSHVQLIFDRRVTKKTPSRFRTRVITEGVTPSLHIDYKGCHVKQYHKEGKALRTETTINNPRDFGVGKSLVNLPALRQIGFAANRRLLNVQTLTHDAILGEDEFNKIDKPMVVDKQRISALRFGDPRTQAILAALVMFLHLPRDFALRDLREHVAPLLGLLPSDLSQCRMSYDLRRLRLHGIIERIKGKHRYRLTSFGLRAAIFLTRTYNRVLRPGLANLAATSSVNSPLSRAIVVLERAVDQRIYEPKLAV